MKAAALSLFMVAACAACGFAQQAPDSNLQRDVGFSRMDMFVSPSEFVSFEGQSNDTDRIFVWILSPLPSNQTTFMITSHIESDADHVHMLAMYPAELLAETPGGLVFEHVFFSTDWMKTNVTANGAVTYTATVQPGMSWRVDLQLTPTDEVEVQMHAQDWLLPAGTTPCIVLQLQSPGNGTVTFSNGSVVAARPLDPVTVVFMWDVVWAAAQDETGPVVHEASADRGDIKFCFEGANSSWSWQSRFRVAHNNSAPIPQDPPLAAPTDVDVVIPRGSIGRGSAAFQPNPLMVPLNTKVTWRNDDLFPHTIVAASGMFASPVLLPGGSFSRVFDMPGIVEYFCSIHGGQAMSGTVMVVAP